MYQFSELIKKIREEANLTQSEFAKILGVSVVLIAMIETGKKDVSKRFILNLAEKMNVHPSSITPFLFTSTPEETKKLSGLEKQLMLLGEKMQTLLIKDRAKKLIK